jgi:threonine/homoserine/homoserine lactone efflux protein
LNFVEFAATIVLVTASGALAPGPLFFATIIHGAKTGAKAGLAVAIGHMLVELPLVLLMASGLLSIANEPLVKHSLGIIGGLALLTFGGLQIHGAIRQVNPNSGLNSRAITRSSLLLGILFSGLNPFFLVWWLSAGSLLVADALLFGAIAGVLLMYGLHVWMDYLWLTVVAHLAGKGRDLLGWRGYRWMLIAFGLILIFFGINFVAKAV